MRKFFALTIVGMLMSLIAVDSGSAIGRRRRQCCPQVSPSPAATQTAVATAVKVKVFTSPKGTTHRIIHTGEFFASRERKAGGPIALNAKAFTDEDFHGTQRMAAKTSIAKAKMDTFATVEDLLFTLVPDVKMMKHTPPISKAKDSDRIKEEMRNVTVTAHLYAASREADNDFHLIIGGDPADDGRLYMNVEVSGLPPDDPFRTALAVPRKQFKDFIGRTQRLFQRQRKHRSAGLLDLAFHHLHQLSPRSPPVVHAPAWVLIVHRTDSIAD